MNTALAFGIAAAVLAVVFVTLGASVTRRPLGRLDARAVYFRGQAVRIARLCTISGRSRALTIGYAVIVAVFAIARLPLWIPLILVLSQMMSQGLSELAKTFYRRTRPDYWLVGLEAGHSYPSGHATTAIVTYVGWAGVCACSGLPGTTKAILIAFLAAWAAGVAWSRLALGAHYLSDVAGGLLLGSAWLCALVALLLSSGWPGRV